MNYLQHPWNWFRVFGRWFLYYEHFFSSKNLVSFQSRYKSQKGPLWQKSIFNHFFNQFLKDYGLKTRLFLERKKSVSMIITNIQHFYKQWFLWSQEFLWNENGIWWTIKCIYNLFVQAWMFPLSSHGNVQINIKNCPKFGTI